MALAIALFAGEFAYGQARRLIIVKVDGLGQQTLKKYLDERDPETGKSVLPWIHHVFVEGGSMLANFYVRGISLSTPSWAMLDTGRPSVIRGNAEFDRTSSRVYDYLNFFPFYFYNARNARADMPAVEVLDEAGIPLLIDSFTPSERLQGMQLFQRGVRWQTLKSTLPRRFSRGARALFNEWQTGFELSHVIYDQLEHELIKALSDERILYLDVFSGEYDHLAHLVNDERSQREVLVKLDGLVGRIWSAVESTPIARETLIVLISDHGMNTDPSVYSQGFNLVNFFTSAEGGGHHVLTNRHPESEYKIKGLDPFVSNVVTPSRDSFYLRDEAEQYPTVFLDLDGNERASVYLRNSDLNEMHILFKRLSSANEQLRLDIAQEIIGIVAKHRDHWATTAQELDVELAALRRAIERNTHEQSPGRIRAMVETWERQFHDYEEHRKSLRAAINAAPEAIASGKLKTEALIPKRALMDHNSIHQLQNYSTHFDGSGFGRVNYLQLLTKVRVRNNVQPGVDPKPVDFIAIPVPRDALASALSEVDRPDANAIWLYASDDQQLLILPRTANRSLRMIPILGLRQDASGRITFTAKAFAPGLPLRYFEDPNLAVSGRREEWLNTWHTETEWFNATHRTQYSNGIVGLAQHFAALQLGAIGAIWNGAGQDTATLQRFALRVREMAMPDMLVFANDHWNFNVRGFNPGGNHGSFLRQSTHSVLMLAGANVPKGRVIERPYDSLSFVPTMLRLIGRGDPALFPGPVISEVTP